MKRSLLNTDFYSDKTLPRQVQVANTAVPCAQTL